MTKDVQLIRAKLIEMLKEHLGTLKVRVDSDTNFEVIGTIEAIQGKKKVEGFYFSSVMPKPKDVRLYFFPAYTHAKDFEGLSDRLQKFKKGKSCFHVKYLDEEMEQEIKAMIGKGIELYQKEGWLVSI